MLLIRFMPQVLALQVFVAGSVRVRAEPPVGELLKLHTREAESYRIFRDEKQTQRLELNSKPVFNWTNVAGEHTQIGHLFVWTWAGRPEVIGTIFSTRTEQPGRRRLIHEFHTLSTARLYPVGPPEAARQWVPER